MGQAGASGEGDQQEPTKKEVSKTIFVARDYSVVHVYSSNTVYEACTRYFSFTSHKPGRIILVISVFHTNTLLS